MNRVGDEEKENHVEGQIDEPLVGRDREDEQGLGTDVHCCCDKLTPRREVIGAAPLEWVEGK